jgi:hypothetical protein
VRENDHHEQPQGEFVLGSIQTFDQRLATAGRRGIGVCCVHK